MQNKWETESVAEELFSKARLVLARHGIEDEKDVDSILAEIKRRYLEWMNDPAW